MNYKEILSTLDDKLKKYFELHKEYIMCHLGCSSCCEKGDYPISQLELEYLMQGYINLSFRDKKIVQGKIKNMQKGGECPFLIDKMCSVYNFRPIICRVHGLSYICKNNTVKVPYCANENKNYSKVYSENHIIVNPIIENLDTPNILKNFEFGEIRNLFDWLN